MLEYELEKSSDRLSREICEVLENGIVFERPFVGTIVIENTYVHKQSNGNGYFVCVPVHGAAIDTAMNPTAEDLKAESERICQRLAEIEEQLKSTKQ